MKRRNTLGPLSPSQANAQRSVAVPRPSIKGDGDLPKARRSLAPSKDTDRRQSNESRRRSFHSRTNKPDPRNLNDKTFQQTAIRNIIACLTSLNYSQQVTPKTLALPSAKDFNSIARFMMQEYDDDYTIEGKLEDELPHFLQLHGYPYPLSKSSLVTVGAPHTWPHVLGALSWLADQLNYSKQADDDIPDADPELWDEVQFTLQAGDMYAKWMKNDDVVWRKDMDQVLEVLGQQQREEETRLDKERLEVQQLEEEIRRLRTTAGPVQLAREELLQAENKQRKTDAMLRNTKAALKQAQRRLQEETANASSKATQLAALEQEVQELQAIVDAQPLNKMEVENLMRTREQRSQKLSELQWKVKEAQREEGELASRWEKHVEELKQHVVRYNELAYQLKLTPHTAKRATGTNLEMRINTDDVGTQIINLDLKGQVWSLLDKIDREMDSTKLDAIKQQGEAKIDHDREVERLASLQASLEHLQKQVEEATQACDEVVANKERMVQELRRGALGLHTDSSSIDAQLQQELEGIEQQRKRLEEDQLQFERERRERVAALGRELAAAKEVVKRGKAEALSQLLANAQRARELRRRMEAAPSLAGVAVPAECQAILSQRRTGSH